jgi:uncharacterized protein YecT (DUF1311 family)
MKQLLTIGFLLGALLSNSVLAEMKQSQLRQLEKSIVEKEWPACVKPRNYYDQVYCAAKVYNLLDNALNSAYIDVRKMLSKEQKNALKKVQITWLHERDDQCAQLNGGSVVMDLGCSKSRTVESLYYINQIKENPADFPLLLAEYKAKK